MRRPPLVLAALSAAASLAAAQAAAASPIEDLRFGSQALNFDASVVELRAPVVETIGVQETAKYIRIELPADILFDFDKATIRDEAEGALSQAAKILRAHGSARVRIEGHTDSKGSDAHNLPLSQKRAEAVRSWLNARFALNLPKGSTFGFGAKRPAVANAKPDGSDDPDGPQRNRRVEIVIDK